MGESELLGQPTSFSLVCSLTLQTPAPATWHPAPAYWPRPPCTPLHVSCRQMSPSPSLETCSLLSPSITASPSSALAPFSLHRGRDSPGAVLLLASFGICWNWAPPSWLLREQGPHLIHTRALVPCSFTVTLVSIPTATAAWQAETHYFKIFNKWDWTTRKSQLRTFLPGTC